MKALLGVLLVLHIVVPGVSLAGSQPSARRVVLMTAERFEFFPSEIVVEEGEQVEIRIMSFDTVHGFRLVGTGTNVLIPKRGRGEASALFSADRPGRYTFECSRLCGAGHNFMRGQLIVRPRSPDGGGS